MIGVRPTAIELTFDQLSSTMSAIVEELRTPESG